MLSPIAVLNLNEAVVFPDDQDCNLFYILSTTPRIRMQDDSPVFSGLFWTDQANGASGSVAGLMGGWINFDVNLGITDELRDKVKQEIKKADIQEARRKQIAKEEIERLTLIAKARGESSVPDPDLPEIGDIHFGAIQFTEGTVTLLEETAGGMVAWSSAGGPASLIGDNNAAFALRLNPEGAAVWYKALKDDVKAISVRYDLKFQARLPSLEIRAWAGSTQSSEINRKVERVWRNTDQGCSDADVERINVKEVRESLLEEGLMNIEINKGSTQISDEHVSQLRNLAIQLIDEKIKEIIKSRIHGMTEEERRTSMIEVMTEEVSSFVELRFTQRDVVTWSVAPQATLMNFLQGISETDKKHVTQLVDLSDPVVSTVEIPVQVNAPWDATPFVTSVKVIALYPSANEEKSWIFSKAQNTDTWRFRRPSNDDGIVEYSYEVYFMGRSEPLVVSGKKTNGTLNIEVGKVGVIDLNFKPHPILSSLSGKNQVTTIQVDVQYKGADAAEHFATSLVFKPEELEGKKLERSIFRPIDAPVDYQVKYYNKDGSTVDLPQKKYYLSESQTGDVFTPSPYEDTLELGVELGIQPDESLKKVLVEFLYQDTVHDFESQEKVVLAAEDDWDAVVARLVQVDRNQQDFSYRYRLLGDNTIARSGWIKASGDQTLVLPILPVTIDISRLQLGEKYLNIILELLYEEPGSEESIRQQIFLSQHDAGKPLHWYIPRMNASHETYTYALTLFPPTGESITIEPQTARGRFLIIQEPVHQ